MESDKLTRRGFLGSGGAAALSGVLEPEDSANAREGQQNTAAPARMNLILFMPDELRGDSLTCYGNPLTKTPNFDQLARSGTRFANCHVQYPICGPSRCSFLTGWPV